MKCYEIEYEADSRFLVVIEAKNEDEAREKFHRGEWNPKDLTEIECYPGDVLKVRELE